MAENISPFDQIRDHLSVCGLFAFPDQERFASAGFTAHLQLVAGFPDWVPRLATVLLLPFDDCRPIPPDLLQHGTAWYGEQRRSGAKVLVSCAAGESRSVAMAIGLLFSEGQPSASRGEFLALAIEICRLVPRAYPHPAPLLSVAGHCGVELDFASLRALYDDIVLPPPFPWDDDELYRALEQAGEGTHAES